jgi:hypothetical protein
MAPIFFPALIAAIVVAGLIHTLAGHYRDKAARRRKREAMARLGVRVRQ